MLGALKTLNVSAVGAHVVVLRSAFVFWKEILYEARVRLVTLRTMTVFLGLYRNELRCHWFLTGVDPLPFSAGTDSSG